jgi:MOSC domain-containing protein YiiM
MQQSGRLEAIWVKRFKRGPMDPRTEARVRAGRGIEDNANQGGKRQITVISAEAWEGLSRELEDDLDPRWRRANVMVSGVDLRESRGRVLALGTVRLRVHGETRPCERMDEAFGGLRAALRSEWLGGVFGEALDDGTISVGDAVQWIRLEEGVSA